MTPKTSIFVVSYAKDFPWLTYLFRSIAKHCTGFHEVVLAIPEKDHVALGDVIPSFGVDCPVRITTFVEEPMDGHMAHLYAKCTADECCTGDFILFVDSDCVWTAPTIPEIYFTHDWRPLPIWVYRPFEIRNGKEWPSHWRACTEEALGIPVEFETMARHPSVIRSFDLADFRRHIEAANGKDLYDYLLPRKRHGLGAGTFSEFCAVGAFCYYTRRNQYAFMLDGPDVPPSNLWQFWSFHGTNNPDVKDKLASFDLL